MFTKIVKMGHVYAIRRGLLFYSYLDLQTPGYWWGRNSEFFIDCISTDVDKIHRIYNQQFGKQIVIK